MASRIKGITVEIGGDTTGLEKALKSVNSTIRNTQSQLKDVTKLLKLDPKNTELLSQKQRLLKDAISATKDKLEALKEAQKQAKEQLENGTLGQDKYDALQREIIETEEELRRLQKEAETTTSVLSKIDSAGKKMEQVGDNIAGAGKKMLTVTAAITGIGTAAVKTAADFDASMSNVSAISGAVGDDLDALRDKAREMGAKTKFSASEAADAMGYMAMAGWKTTDMLSGIEGVMNLAAASGEDLSTTSDIVTDALTAFGLSAKDSGHFADILAAASSNANTNVSMMGQTFKYTAPIAGALGFSAEDTAEAIGLMANAGIKSTQAGTSLRTIMNSLTGPIDLVGEDLGEVTIQTTNADGSMRDLSDILADCRSAFSLLSESEQANTAEALVGKNAMSGFLALMNAAPGDVEKLQTAIATCSDEIDGYNGTAEKMAAVMQDNLQGQITILKSQLQELAISFGEVLMPTIRKIVSSIQGFIDKLNGMDDGTREMVIKIALLVAAIGPFLVVLGTVIAKIGITMQGFVKLAGGIAKLKASMASGSGIAGKLGAAIGGISGPILAVIGVIALLVAAFVNLWKNNEDFRKQMTAIWGSIKTTIADFVSGVKERLSGLSGTFSTVIGAVKKVWNGFCQVLAPIFVAAFQTIQTVLKTVLGVITGLIDIFIGAFTGNWDQAWTGVKEIFSSVWEGIKGIIGTALGAVRGVADVFLSWFGTNWDQVWTTVKSVFQSIWTSITAFLTSAWETIKAVVQTGVMLIGSILSAAFQIITLPFRLIWENCKDQIKSAWNTIKSVVSSALGAIRKVITSVMNAVKSVIISVWNAINSRVSSVLGSIRNVVSTVFGAIKTVASSVWNGIKSIISTVLNAIRFNVSSIFNSVKSSVSSVFNSIKSQATSAWNAVKNAIINPITTAKNKVLSLVSSMKSAFNNMKLSLPHIKLPHFSISGSLSIAPPSVPRLSISWYKEGGIMDGPTIFGMNGSSLMAGGEAGPEAILPLKGFYQELNRLLAEKLDMSGMEEYLQIIAANSSRGIYLDDGTLVGHILPAVDAGLAGYVVRNGRGNR